MAGIISAIVGAAGTALGGLGIGGGLALAGGLGAAGSLAGGLLQANSANKGISAETSMFNAANSALSPYYTAGANALGPLQGLLGTGPAGTPSPTDILKNVPGFNFISSLAQQGVSNQGTATGLGGNTLLAGANAGTNVALSSAWNPIVSNLLSLVNTGSSAAGTLAGAAVGTGANIAGSNMNVGNALAGGVTGAAGSIGNSLTTNALIRSGLLGNASMYGTGQQGLINAGVQPGVSNGGFNFLDNQA